MRGARPRSSGRLATACGSSPGRRFGLSPPLNRDGSLGFAARFALRLREEHADAISGARTTEDIVLRSVNEVGHLLYFAGTNSWLVLRDDAGRTLDELSR